MARGRVGVVAGTGGGSRCTPTQEVEKEKKAHLGVLVSVTYQRVECWVFTRV